MIRKITEEEVRAHWVQRLSDTPNRLGKFGSAGMSAAEMKAAYDALPLCIVTHFNELVTLIEEGRLAEVIPSTEGRTLRDFFLDLVSGELAAYLTVDGTRTLAALAAALDTHDHDGRYAPLGSDGRLPASFLPLGYGEEAVEAEAARREAEEERREAETARDVRESEREARLTGCEEEVARLSLSCDGAVRAAAEATRTAENLAAATQGATHTFYRDTAAAYEKIPPEGALPWARLLRLGGAANGEFSPTRAVVSHSAHLLPYPYPGLSDKPYDTDFTVTDVGDGSLILDGTATKNISIILYRETDGLALPPEPIYIDPGSGPEVILYVKTGPSGTVYKNGIYVPSEEDLYFGGYLVYLYVPKGTVLERVRVIPTITRGTKRRREVLYRPPVRLGIPEAITSLPGYGRGGNYLDLEDGYYHQRYTLTGEPLAEEALFPLDGAFPEDGWLPAEEDGRIEFENDRGCPIDAEVLFGVRLL